MQGFEIKTDDISLSLSHFLNNTYLQCVMWTLFFRYPRIIVYTFYFTPPFTTIAYIHAGCFYHPSLTYSSSSNFLLLLFFILFSSAHCTELEREIVARKFFKIYPVILMQAIKFIYVLSHLSLSMCMHIPCPPPLTLIFILTHLIQLLWLPLRWNVYEAFF